MLRKKTAASITHMQGLIANYIQGLAMSLNRTEGHKSIQTGSDPIFREGEQDGNNLGRATHGYPDNNMVEARLLVRLRSKQTGAAYLKLPTPDKIQFLQNEGQRVIDEIQDDGDFEPYSEETKKSMGEEGADGIVRLKEAERRAAEAVREALLSKTNKEDAETQLQMLKRQEAEHRHDKEKLLIENAALKAQLANPGKTE